MTELRSKRSGSWMRDGVPVLPVFAEVEARARLRFDMLRVFEGFGLRELAVVLECVADELRARCLPGVVELSTAAARLLDHELRGRGASASSRVRGTS